MMKFSLALLSALAAVFASAQSCHAFQSTSSSKSYLANPLRETTFLQPLTTWDAQNKKRGIASSNANARRATTTELQFSPLNALAASPLGAVSVLAGIVVFHEAGHYLAARSFNISVDEFSVGFGPKLLGFNAVGNEFNLRALPLGGYVRFPENYDIKQAQDMQDEASQAFMKRRAEEGWVWWQDAVNILTFGQWDEQRRQAKKRDQAQEVADQDAERSWWQKALPGGSAVVDKEDPEDFEIEYYEDPNLLQNRPWPQRAVVLSGGVIFNMILAFLLYFGEINFGNGIPSPVFDSGVVVSQVPRSDGASAGLLNKGDVIVGINGKAVTLSSSNPAAAQKQVSDIIGVIRGTADGDAVQLSVKREGKAVDVAVKPQQTGSSTQSIGVFLGPNFKAMERIQSNNVGESAQLAYKYLMDVVSQTASGVLTLIGMLISGQGGGQSVSGPIGLIRSGTEVVSTRDLTAVVLFAAAISVNLGVINALPLPALDGGQLVFVLAEALTGRKVDQRFQEGITSVAVLFLLLVSVSTAFSDVGSILSGIR